MPETASTKSLLIIEDDLSLIEVIDAMLGDLRSGLEWEYVTSGEDALALIERRGTARAGAPYSLVLSDVFLDGDVTGLDVWQTCQRSYPGMPFVITSARDYDRYVTNWNEVNKPPVFLPKPLSARGCRLVFEEYLSGELESRIPTEE